MHRGADDELFFSFDSIRKEKSIMAARRSQSTTTAPKPTTGTTTTNPRWIRLADLPRNEELSTILPRKSTFEKWRHLNKHPELFVKVGRTVFLDLGKYFDMAEAGKLAG